MVEIKCYVLLVIDLFSVFFTTQKARVITGARGNRVGSAGEIKISKTIV